MFIAALIVVVIVSLVFINNAMKEANGGVSFMEQKRIDKINWNNGKCNRCGYHWTLYEYDRTLGRVYICTKCGEMTHAVTYVDKHYYACDDPDHPDYIEPKGGK
jgi:hypothetical protein